MDEQFDGVRVFSPRDWYIDDSDRPREVGTFWVTELGEFYITRCERVGESDRYKLYGVPARAHRRVME